MVDLGTVFVGRAGLLTTSTFFSGFFLLPQHILIYINELKLTDIKVNQVIEYGRQQIETNNILNKDSYRTIIIQYINFTIRFPIIL